MLHRAPALRSGCDKPFTSGLHFWTSIGEFISGDFVVCGMRPKLTAICRKSYKKYRTSLPVRSDAGDVDIHSTVAAQIMVKDKLREKKCISKLDAHDLHDLQTLQNIGCVA